MNQTENGFKIPTGLEIGVLKHDLTNKEWIVMSDIRTECTSSIYEIIERVKGENIRVGTIYWDDGRVSLIGNGNSKRLETFLSEYTQNIISDNNLNQ